VDLCVSEFIRVTDQLLPARVFTRIVPELPPGDYVAIVLLDYGGDEIAAAQVEFKVP